MSNKLMTDYWKNGPSSPTDNIVLIALANYADEKGVCWPSLSKLASRTRFSERTVRYALRSLEEQRFISSTERYGKHGVRISSRYQLHHSEELDLWDEGQPERQKLPMGHDAPGEGARQGRVMGHDAPGDGARQGRALYTPEYTPLESPVLSSGTPSVRTEPPEAETKKRGNGIPATRTEAIEWAAMENVPAEFAGEIFDDLEGVNWIDWHDRAVTNWRSHIRYRWSRSQKTKSAYGNGKKHDGSPDRDQFTYAGRARRNGGN